MTTNTYWTDEQAATFTRIMDALAASVGSRYILREFQIDNIGPRFIRLVDTQTKCGDENDVTIEPEIKPNGSLKSWQVCDCWGNTFDLSDPESPILDPDLTCAIETTLRPIRG